MKKYKIKTVPTKHGAFIRRRIDKSRKRAETVGMIYLFSIILLAALSCKALLGSAFIAGGLRGAIAAMVAMQYTTISERLVLINTTLYLFTLLVLFINVLRAFPHLKNLFKKKVSRVYGLNANIDAMESLGHIFSCSLACLIINHLIIFSICGTEAKLTLFGGMVLGLACVIHFCCSFAGGKVSVFYIDDEKGVSECKRPYGRLIPLIRNILQLTAIGVMAYYVIQYNTIHSAFVIALSGERGVLLENASSLIPLVLQILTIIWGIVLVAHAVGPTEYSVEGPYAPGRYNFRTFSFLLALTAVANFACRYFIGEAQFTMLNTGAYAVEIVKSQDMNLLIIAGVAFVMFILDFILKLNWTKEAREEAEEEEKRAMPPAPPAPSVHIKMPPQHVSVQMPPVNVNVPQQKLPAMPPINIHVPRQAVPNVNIQMPKQAPVNVYVPKQQLPAMPPINVHVPQQKLPAMPPIQVNVPKQPTQIQVNVPRQQMAPINVHVPKQQLPAMPPINIQVPKQQSTPIQVNVPQQSTPIQVNVPKQAPMVMPPINVHVPAQQVAPTPIQVNVPKQSMAMPPINVHVPAQAATPINVHVPKQDPVVMPPINVHVPKQDPVVMPPINVHPTPVQVHVPAQQTAPIQVNVPQQQPTPINVNVPQQQPAPVNVSVPKQDPPQVNIQMPGKEPVPVPVNVNVPAAVAPVTVNVPKQDPSQINVHIPEQKPSLAPFSVLHLDNGNYDEPAPAPQPVAKEEPKTAVPPINVQVLTNGEEEKPVNVNVTTSAVAQPQPAPQLPPINIQVHMPPMPTPAPTEVKEIIREVVKEEPKVDVAPIVPIVAPTPVVEEPVEEPEIEVEPRDWEVHCPNCSKGLKVSDKAEYHRCPSCSKVFELRKNTKEVED